MDDPNYMDDEEISKFMDNSLSSVDISITKYCELLII